MKKTELTRETNKKCRNWKKHKYNKGDKILLKNVWKIKFKQNIYLGPYVFIAIGNNDTLMAHKDEVTDTSPLYTSSFIMGQYDMHKYTQLQDQFENLPVINK